jgi:hypothetical protein
VGLSNIDVMPPTWYAITAIKIGYTHFRTSVSTMELSLRVSTKYNMIIPKNM